MPVGPATLMGLRSRQGSLRYPYVSPSEEIEVCVGEHITEAEPLQFHEALEIWLVTRGTARIRLFGAQRTLEVGSAALVAPGELHAVDGPHCGGYSFFALRIDPAVLDRRRASTAVSRDPIPIPGVALADSALCSQLMAVHETWANGASAREKHGVLDNLIDRLASSGLPLVSRSADHAGSHARAIDQTLAYLRERYADEVSLSELAAVAQLSRFHFLRVFSGALGVTPRQFQLLLRVAHAKALLRGKREIVEVALLTGFFDQSHLTRCFHHIVGVTPGEYRLGLAMRADRERATSCKTRGARPVEN